MSTHRILEAVYASKPRLHQPKYRWAISAAIESLEERALFSAISSTTAGGNWNDTNTWVGGVVPNNGVDVTIVAGATVTVSDSEGAALLTTQVGSTLTIVKTDSNHVGFLQVLTAASAINGTLDINAGGSLAPQYTLTTSGTSIVTGGGIRGGHVDNTGTMTFNGGDLNGVILTNDGTLNVSNGLAIGNANIVNDAAGVWNITDNSGIIYDSFSPAGNNTLINKGTLNKTGGAGTFTLIQQYTFENIGGTFNLQSGNFSIVGNIRFQDGTLNLSAGTTLSIDSTAPGNNLISGTVVGTGVGTFAMNAGVFAPGSPTLTDADGTLNLPAGMASITGAQFVDRDVNHIFNTGVLTLTGSASHAPISLTNQGTFINSGTAAFVTGSFVNDTNGTLNLTNDAAITGTNLYNKGTILKSAGTAITVVSSQYFAQGGTLNIQTGAISLQSFSPTYIAGAPFTIATGAVLDIHPVYTVNVSGTLSASGGGTVTFTSGFLDGAVQFDAADGTLPAILNFASNTFYDKGGVIDKGNTGLTNTGDIYFQGANNLDRMTNQGTLLIDAGPFNFAQDLTNDTSGVINFTTDTVLTQSGGILTNKGLIIKSGGTGMVAFTSTSMVNQGTIEVASGTLQLPSGATGIFSYNDQSQKQITSGQTLKVDAGAALTLDQPLNIVANSGTVILGGTGATFPALASITTNIGTLRVLSGASFTSGASLTNTGTLTVGGDVTVAGDLTESAATGTPVLDFLVAANPNSAGIPSLKVTGTTTLAGNLTAELANGFVLTAEGSYTAATFSTVAIGAFASTTGVGPAFTVVVNPTSIILTTAGNVGPTQTTGLSPVILRSTIPAALVAGVKSHGVVTVTVTNTADAVDKGQNLISLYATTNGVIDGASQLVGRVEKKLNLAAGRFINVTIPIRSIILATGTYTLLPQATNASHVVISATTGPTLVASAPVVLLTGTVAIVKPSTITAKKSGSAMVTITNSGNTNAIGPLVITLSPSSDGVSSVPGITLGTLKVAHLNLKPGKPSKHTIHVKLPAGLATGTYFPLATLSFDNAESTAVGATEFSVG